MTFILLLAFLYVALGVLTLTVIMVGYYSNFTKEERAMERSIEGYTTWSSIFDGIKTVLTWPKVVRYIVRGTREHFAVNQMDDDRAERLGI